MSEIKTLEQAANGWVGKASLKVGSPLSGRLEYAYSMVEGASNEIREDGNLEKATKQLQEAKSTLRSLNNPSLWEGNENYYENIYKGGDGSGYDSAHYQEAGVSDSLDAIDKMQAIALSYLEASKNRQPN